MGIAYHSVYAPDGAPVNLFDRIALGTVTATYPAATATNTASVVTVTWSEPIPTPYSALMTPIEDSVYYVTAPTTTSLVLHVSPRAIASTLTGGAVEILLLS